MAEPSSYRPRDVPPLPGVYRFFNSKDEVIYVGKALSLKSRLSNYFQNNLPERTNRMVHEAVRVDWTIVDTEIEALQLEFSWIKQYSPDYNVQFRDDKSYPYLAITLNDQFPRLLITRNQKKAGVKYFGPFTQAWALRNTFEVVLKVFRIRSCTDANFEKAQRAKRQCLLGDIGKCAAPCVGWVSEEEHRGIADRIVSFMDAGQAEIIPTLEKEMALASDSQEYERAGKIRDQIAALKHAQESTEGALPESLFADVIALHRDGAFVAASVFVIRGGAIKGSRSWLVDQKLVLEGQDEITALFASMYSHVEKSEIPAEILINEESAEIPTLALWLSERKGSKVEIKVPVRGDKADLIDTVRRNAQYALIQHVNKRSADVGISGQALVEVQQALALPELPLRIECYDISNISGTTVVASMVVFEDGVPKKSEYRRFIIDTTTAWDDTRAMHQVLTRRLKRLADEQAVDPVELHQSGGKRAKFSYQPHLIIVDGGVPQVNSAVKALSETGFSHIPLCGLAKRLEEVWLPGNPVPVMLGRSSEGLYLLQRIRDEAHRFAITFHRSRRSRAMLESLLDGVPQLGDVRRKALLDYFGSVSALRKASTDQIALIPGIGSKIAEIIAESISREKHEGFDAQTGEVLKGS